MGAHQGFPEAAVELLAGGQEGEDDLLSKLSRRAASLLCELG
jgi:hypothetical protein